MNLSYTKPNWTNDEGTAINASRLQAISDVLDGLVNQTGTKPIVSIAFTDANMTVTYADGSIEMFENPNKGERGEEGASLGVRHSKEGKVTTVELYNSETGETVDMFVVLDGLDGAGGTSDYAELSNLPQINGVTLTGNKKGSELKLFSYPTGTVADGKTVIWNATNSSWIIAYQPSNKTTFDNSKTKFSENPDNVQSAIESARNFTAGKIGNPSSKSTGQVLTYDGTNWVAWTNYARNQQFENTVTAFNPAPGTTQKAIEATKALVDTKADATELDTTVATGTVSNGTVAFTVTDTSLAYDLYVDIGTPTGAFNPVAIESITISGSIITYKLKNAPEGAECKLRKINL